MKCVLMMFAGILLFYGATAQDENLDNLKDIKANLQPLAKFIEAGKYKNVANLILNDPEIYNKVWNKVYGSLREKSDISPLKNLKIDFKTFQADSSKTSMGFSYVWDYDINKKNETDYKRTDFITNLNVSGNIAFRKKENPNDFQEAKLSIGHYAFLGGIVKKLDAATVKKLNDIRIALASIEDKEELKNSPLWEDLKTAMHIKNHYHFSFTGNGGWEGSQDFSKSQFTYGLQLRISAKSYLNKNTLAQLNLLDYPFALIRYVTGTDKNLTPYGAALPLITFGIERIKPVNDSARKNLLNNEIPFTRFRFEAGFRTLLASVESIPIHFNAAYRFFQELNAPKLVKNANLDRCSYFTCSVTGNNTYFASYSYGKLPFDRTNNAVYEIGFKLNL